MKLYRNWIINEVARAGEHTNERTYIRTYSHTYVRDRPYIPSTTLLCEGIIKKEMSSFWKRGDGVVRRYWVNLQCRRVLLIWIIVGQGPIALAVGGVV